MTGATRSAAEPMAPREPATPRTFIPYPRVAMPLPTFPRPSPTFPRVARPSPTFRRPSPTFPRVAIALPTCSRFSGVPIELMPKSRRPTDTLSSPRYKPTDKPTDETNAGAVTSAIRKQRSPISAHLSSDTCVRKRNATTVADTVTTTAQPVARCLWSIEATSCCPASLSNRPKLLMANLISRQKGNWISVFSLKPSSQTGSQVPQKNEAGRLQNTAKHQQTNVWDPKSTTKTGKL
mmetsp:Transcript_31072/g.63050  ORF Transcript_31072/g.63050 Transcript_31072/m.63050 type:complete len:236 (+) Transcript_31072:282-989(+)